MDGYGSKIWKIKKRRPAVSNETILAIRQEFFLFFGIIGFLINAALLSVYFILHYHLFFRKEIFFSNVYIPANTIFECFYIFFWFRAGPSIKYVCN